MIKYLLPAFVLLYLLFFGSSAALSDEGKEKFSAPGPTLETAFPKSNRIEVIPVKPGEEIPDWVARWELARVLSYAKLYDESINEYEKLLRKRPDLTEAKLELANVFFWKGNPDRAIRLLKQVPQKEMTEETKVLMADLLVAQKDYAEAEPLYKAYLNTHPEDQAVRLRLAEMLSWQKKYDASLNEYRKILKKRPDDMQVRRRYAFVLIWAGKHSEAASELKKTLD